MISGDMARAETPQGTLSFASERVAELVNTSPLVKAGNSILRTSFREPGSMSLMSVPPSASSWRSRENAAKP